MHTKHCLTCSAQARPAGLTNANSKRVVAYLCIALCLPAPAQAANNMDAQAQNLFNSLGAVGNVTAPQAFKGQTMNTFTGGSLYYRAPQKNYQLASLQLPYVRGG